MTSAVTRPSMWRRWVDLMDEREAPTSLALLRIALGAVLLTDLFWVARYDLVELLWAPHVEGGLGLTSTWDSPPLTYQIFGHSAAAAWITFGLVVGSCLTFTLGLFTRASTLVLLLSYAQLAAMMPLSDRGIDQMFRAVMVLLLLSSCGQTLSLDARRKTGRFVDESAARAWPRYLIVLQLAWTYFTAGVHKTQSAWWPAGDFSAVWRVVNDPHFARFDLADQTWLYPLTQLGTAGTMFFEIGAPLFLLSLYYRRSAHRPGRLRAVFNRVRFREVWIGLGVLFHVGLVASLNLGIFPLGMLALYPAFFPPETWRRKAGQQGKPTWSKRTESLLEPVNPPNSPDPA